MQEFPLLESSSTPTRSRVDRAQLRQLLQEHFGHADFRGLQFNAIEAVLSGNDCFCLMPTGAGKSICYQIPALAKPGLVLVVSPLIALMENQVAALKNQNIPAEYLSSTQSAATKTAIYEDLDSGRPALKLLYVTPELVATTGFMSRLKKLHGRGLVSLVAIDEAHCISSWGHDFRPTYKELSSLRRNLPGIPILALTATAAKRVQADVVRSLCLQRPSILCTSFNRPNIFYEVRFKDLLRSAYDDLRDTLMQAPTECGIIYCHTRQACDEIGGKLKSDGLSCRVYHAGINGRLRTQALEDWASGRVALIVATVAFGMGIDRKDVRLVCHFSIPKSLEGFYQESGRCGRDEQPARSILYYSLDDRRTMEFLITKSKSQKPHKEATEQLQECMKSFGQMVAYCDGTVCRRKTLLEYFGEQVSPTLCGRTCDACSSPERLSKNLEALKDVSSSRWPSVRIQPARVPSADKSEFWNYGEGDKSDEEEDEISGSDDEETSLAQAAASKAGARVEKRVAALLRAEEEFGSVKQEKKVKRSVDEYLRNSALARLRSAVGEASKRHGCSSEVESIASALEVACFNKYGKSGRSFYNSQLASTIRWLSSCTHDELVAKTQARV